MSWGGFTMLSSLTPSEHILAIHQRLQTKSKTTDDKLLKMPLDKNKAEFHQRLPKKIALRLDVVMESSNREATLISQHGYRVLRQFQLERIMPSMDKRNQPRPTNILINVNSKEAKALKLKYPVLIGENGELIIIMKTKRQQLGEGNYGSVFIGMDLDTHKLIALKYHDLAKATKKQIRKEINVMEGIGRLVSSLDNPITIISADELAWGTDFAQITIDRINNPLSKDEILYRVDMSLKFLEQVSLFHDKGYLNRDVKLDNMMWDQETKKATMIDFGFAKKAKLIKGASVMGTSIYMAPEVRDGSYSTASDAYACGVALLEIFSNNDLFDHIDEWDLLVEEYSKHHDPKNFKSFFKMAAPDLLDNPKLLTDLKPIVNVIKKLLDPNFETRASLQDVMIALQRHHEMLSFAIFKERSLPLVISPEDMKNAQIREYVYRQIDAESMSIIHSDSYLIVLYRAVLDEHKLVFEKIIEPSKLFEPINHGFAQMLLKVMIEKYLDGGSTQFLASFLKAAAKNTRLNESVEDIHNILKAKRAAWEVKKIKGKTKSKLDDFDAVMPTLLSQAIQSFTTSDLLKVSHDFGLDTIEPIKEPVVRRSLRHQPKPFIPCERKDSTKRKIQQRTF
jgi:serine/threonine protein kinase